MILGKQGLGCRIIVDRVRASRLIRSWRLAAAWAMEQRSQCRWSNGANVGAYCSSVSDSLSSVSDSLFLPLSHSPQLARHTDTEPQQYPRAGTAGPYQRMRAAPLVPAAGRRLGPRADTRRVLTAARGSAGEVCDAHSIGAHQWLWAAGPVCFDHFGPKHSSVNYLLSTSMISFVTPRVFLEIAERFHLSRPNWDLTFTNQVEFIASWTKDPLREASRQILGMFS